MMEANLIDILLEFLVTEEIAPYVYLDVSGISGATGFKECGNLDCIFDIFALLSKILAVEFLFIQLNFFLLVLF